MKDEAADQAKPQRPETKSFLLGWTSRPGGPQSSLPEDPPTLVVVQAADLRVAVMKLKHHMPGGARILFAAETKGVTQLWDHIQIRRLDSAKGTLLCFDCGSPDLGPFRGGQDPEWFTCRACGQEQTRAQASGEAGERSR